MQPMIQLTPKWNKTTLDFVHIEKSLACNKNLLVVEKEKT